MSLRSNLEYLRWFISRGEVPPVWRLIPSEYRPSENPPRGIARVADEEIPPWIDTQCSASHVSNQTGSQNEYYGALVAPEGECSLEATVTPPDPAVGLSFHLLNTRHADRISIVAEGTTVDEAKTRTTASLRTNEDFWLSNAVPVDLEFDDPVTELTLEVDFDRSPLPVPGAESTRPAVSVPSVGTPSPDGPPVFLISVDSLRYDALAELEPAIEALGPDAVIPADPWTQGHWTRPSHATMLTGTHPGTHRYVASVQQLGDIKQVSPEVPMVSELLRDHGYRCAACVARSGLSPKLGFGRGFQSYTVRNRDWKLDTETASTSIEEVRKWLDAAVGPDGAGRNVFYFLHLFDPHYPYLPPARLRSNDDVDLPEILEYYDEHVDMEDFVTEAQGSDNTYDPSTLERLRGLYDRSVRYVAGELARLFEHMKKLGIFDDALVIVTGDHGEQFFERGFMFHETLRDENLRPGMVVKPPHGSDMSVPDRANTIDFAPTICEVAGVDPAPEFAGQAWGSTPDETLANRPRVTEAIHGIDQEWYTIAVQHDGTKAIFCWPSAFPERPDAETVDEAPEHAEFYERGTDPSGTPEAVSPDEAERGRLLDLARSFVGSAQRGEAGRSVTVSNEVVDRLEDLGYR